MLNIELSDNRNVTVDSFSKFVDLKDYLKIFEHSIEPPSMKISPSIIFGKQNILVKQNDKNSNKIKLYKKVIPLYNANFKDNVYNLVSEIDIIKENDFKPIEVEINTKNSTIYKCVAVSNSGKEALTYTSALVQPTKQYKNIGIVLITKLSEDGIYIDVRTIPLNVISIKILKRDTTLNEKKFSNVSTESPVRLSNSSNLIFLDTNVKNDHVYEYKAELFYKNGDISLSVNSSIIEKLPLLSKSTKTTIKNKEENIDNIQFTIETTSIPNKVEAIKLLLEKNNIFNIFSKEVENEREKLNELIAYKIYRTDLLTGELEQFDSIVGNFFSDKREQEISNVSPLDLNHKYRYEVRTLLREPESLFENFKKIVTDVNGKKYEFSPFKFFHPLALQKGTLSTIESLKKLHAKDNLTFGDIGIVAIVESSSVFEQSSIANVSMTKLTNKLISIKWTFVGNSNNVDHFILMRNSSTMKSIVGRAHANIDSNLFNYIHKMDDNDIGTIYYSVAPVFNDYTVGKFINSEKILL